MGTSEYAAGFSPFAPGFGRGYALKRALKRPVAHAPASQVTPGGEEAGAIRWVLTNEQQKLGRLGLNPKSKPTNPAPGGTPAPGGKPGSLSPGSIIGFPGLAPKLMPGSGGGSPAPGGVPGPGGGAFPSITPRVIVAPSPATGTGAAGGAGGESTSPLFSESDTPYLNGGIDPTTGEAVGESGGTNWLLIAGAAALVWFLLKRR